MVGLLALAGVALLLSSVGRQGKPRSEDESTDQGSNGFPYGRGRLGFGLKVPPSAGSEIGIGRVADPRYDAKGGTDMLEADKRGSRIPGSVPVPPSPDRAVSVMPRAGYLNMIPANYRPPVRR